MDAFSIDRILTPEKDAAIALVQLLELGTEVEHFVVDDNKSVFKFSVPGKLVGYKMNELGIEKEFNIRVISLIRGKQISNALGITRTEKVADEAYPEDYELGASDGLLCYGAYSDFINFWKSVR